MHDAPTSHIDKESQHDSKTHPTIYPKPQSPSSTEERGNTTRSHGHISLLYTIDQMPLDGPTSETNITHLSNIPTEDEKTKEKKVQNNRNHHNPQHPHRHHKRLTQPPSPCCSSTNLATTQQHTFIYCCVLGIIYTNIEWADLRYESTTWHADV